MKNSTLFNLTIVVLLFIALILGKNYWTRFIEGRPNEYTKALKKINMDDVSKIYIAQNQDILEIEKTFEGWIVASKSADSKKIDDLLTSLKPSQNPILVAESALQLEKLNLTSEKGITLSIETTENQKIEFLIGSKSDAKTSIMIVGQGKAYNLENISSISIDPNDWFDLTIVDLDSSSIQTLTYQNNLGQTYSINANGEKKWQFANSQILTNDDAINTMLMSLNPLIASKLAEEEKIQDFDTNLPTFSLNITKSDGQNLNLEFFKGESEYLVKKLPEEDYFIISESKADSLNQTQESLTKTAE